MKSEVSQTIYDNEIQLKIPPGTIPGRFVSAPCRFPRPTGISGAAKTYLDQTIFDFWGTPSRYQAAVLGKSASLLDTAKTRDDVFLNVAQGYFSTLRAQKLEVVATQDVADLKAHLKIAQDQYEFGVVTYNDVLQAEVSLADAQQRLIVAKTDIIDIRSALNKVLALPVSAPTVLKDEKLETQALGPGRGHRRGLEAAERPQGLHRPHPPAGKGGDSDQGPVFPRFDAQAGHNYQQNQYHAARHPVVRHLRDAVDPVFRAGHQGRRCPRPKLKVEQLQEQHKDLNEQVRLDVQNAYLKVEADR